MLVPPLCRADTDAVTQVTTDPDTSEPPDTPKVKATFSLSMVSDFFRQSSSVSGTPQEASALLATDRSRDDAGETADAVTSSTSDDSVCLHDVYAGRIIDWFRFCQNSGTATFKCQALSMHDS